jgi:TonB family protein
MLRYLALSSAVHILMFLPAALNHFRVYPGKKTSSFTVQVLEQGSQTAKTKSDSSKTNPSKGKLTQAQDLGHTAQVEGRLAASELTANIQPDYPTLSRKLGEEGEVTIDLTVQPDGTVRGAKVGKSSGFPRLDEAALKAVNAAKFSSKPGAATLSQSVEKSLAIVFKLQ